jgi:type IV secretory pathway VirB10-like protein
MASALAAQIGQTTMWMLEKNLNIKHTLEARPGYEFNVVVVKDLFSWGLMRSGRTEMSSNALAF